MRKRFSALNVQSGFTLVEVIIAMSLFALMAVILYGTFDLGHRAVEKGEVAWEINNRVRMVNSILGDHLRSAHPYRLSPRNPAIFFQGEESRLTFVSAVSLGLGGRGMSKVSLYWQEEGNGYGSLILEEKMPVRVQEEDAGGGYSNTVVLESGVADVRIDYLPARPEEDQWVDRWDASEKRALPRAVRIHFKNAGEKERQWTFPVMMTVLAP
jgi:prepilin-type N-terminal cleavage/methylation domain-containing protein